MILLKSLGTSAFQFLNDLKILPSILEYTITFLMIFKILFIFIFYFLAASGLSCGMQVRGLLSSCGVWVISSLVVAHRLQGAWAL